ncbi:hypothetical protein IM792_19890 [Mucilaginibacter sp. JRF]|uniref:hypothetical protein n=1 Tax=Mucilaginibacter sp. JRF TaxID=2780088 RepID=UPI00187FB9C1|nr:hypothetical protein [Mucilaginibacter sp. JRF]MBE9586721.1 hypothetical protein [Mucilaginibacter sp. JRF]
MNTRSSFLSLNIIVVLILSFFFNTANAQRRSNRALNYEGDAAAYSGGGGFGGEDAQWGVSLQGGFDSPKGDLGTLYKGAPLVGISVLRHYKGFTFGITFSRHSYKPAADSLYSEYVMGEESMYTQSIKLSNNRFTGLYASAVYNIGLSDNFKCYGGVNLGNMSSSYSIEVKSTDVNYTGTYTDQFAYIAPKLGLDVGISNGFSIGIEGKYNIFTKGSVNTRTGGEGFSSQRSVAAAATLTYSF